MPRLMMSRPWRCNSAAFASTAKAFSSPIRPKAELIAIKAAGSGKAAPCGKGGAIGQGCQVVSRSLMLCRTKKRKVRPCRRDPAKNLKPGWTGKSCPLCERLHAAKDCCCKLCDEADSPSGKSHPERSAELAGTRRYQQRSGSPDPPKPLSSANSRSNCAVCDGVQSRVTLAGRG